MSPSTFTTGSLANRALFELFYPHSKQSILLHAESYFVLEEFFFFGNTMNYILLSENRRLCRASWSNSQQHCVNPAASRKHSGSSIYLLFVFKFWQQLSSFYMETTVSNWISVLYSHPRSTSLLLIQYEYNRTKNVTCFWSTFWSNASLNCKTKATKLPSENVLKESVLHNMWSISGSLDLCWWVISEFFIMKNI